MYLHDFQELISLALLPPKKTLRDGTGYCSDSTLLLPWYVRQMGKSVTEKSLS